MGLSIWITPWAEADWSLKYALGTGISGIQEQYFPLKYNTVFFVFLLNTYVRITS